MLPVCEVSGAYISLVPDYDCINATASYKLVYYIHQNAEVEVNNASAVQQYTTSTYLKERTDSSFHLPSHQWCHPDHVRHISITLDVDG